MDSLHQRKRVAIIGAGSAGLVMATQLPPTHFETVMLERRSAVGGIWRYDNDPGPCKFLFDQRGKAYPTWEGKGKDGDNGGLFFPPGPMYDGLRTNIPCDLMAYRDSPFRQGLSLFPHREAVERYIEDFAKNNGLQDKVRFNTAVASVKRLSHTPGQGSKWQVISRSLFTGDSTTEEYDFIVAASGRCNTPSVPFIPGLWTFKGQLLHSAWYRYPQPFAGKTVLVVGNSSSGCDIARELLGHITRDFDGAEEWMSKSGTGVQVYQSYEEVDKPPPLDYDPRDENSPEWSRKIKVVPKMDKVEPPQVEGSKGRITFEDGTVLDNVDTIVFGTGYSYDLPYIDQTLEPFKDKPLLASLPPQSPATDESLSSYISTHQSSQPYRPPFRISPFLANLDDWSLFYAPDPSLAILGVPIRVVPFPFTNVQARIVSAFWSSIVPRLPYLDRTLPTTDAERFTKWLDEESRGEVRVVDLGYPSDSAYMNALISLLPDEMRRHGKDQDLTVEGFKGLEGNNQPKEVEGKITQATDEGWYKVAEYRNQRRATGKRLRREHLGY